MRLIFTVEIHSDILLISLPGQKTDGKEEDTKYNPID